MQAIVTKDLRREFGKLVAVKGVSLTVESGEIFGFLGPNGAGKSTTIKMLCTLLKPTSGEALLAGYDIAARPDAVRRSIGLVFQDPSLDDRLTAQENLYFHAILYGVPAGDRPARMESVLRMVDLYERRHDLVRTFSGGMKRRLEIARGLLHHPKVLFLDEPTVGLDPQTRAHIWQYIHEIRRREGMTIFLTTHYMDEAENCDRIAIIDHGEIVALDTPAALKRLVGGDLITVRSDDDDQLAAELQADFGVTPVRTPEGLRFEVQNGEEFIPRFVTSEHGRIKAISLRKPTLDDVFLKLTGREIREENVSAVDAMRERRRMRQHHAH
ncbi:MAG TPA: ATP-binding cassette domain-containing protein [Firmicutes bacterium]|nr:ATP-binding cassette domain-containing protein [Bacillota bacterium]